jgi:uncharacterized protein (TIGR02646 family)
VIFVKRPPEPATVKDALNKPFAKFQNKTELERAREYYATEPPPTKAFKFERYSEHDVCFALDELFHEKCAYCETSYRAVDSRDVEHFRPKGGVAEAPQHPGYWWLAASWSNLLPSCPPCNQRRRQTLYEPGTPLEEFEAARRRQAETLSGKKNSFPVSKGNWATSEEHQLTTEDPLLINPCERDPADHLEFVFDWKRPQYIWEAEQVTAFVRPRAKAGQDDAYGKASIAIYGLRRAGLFREHLARLKEMQLLCIPIVDIVRDLAQAPPPANETALIERLKKYKKSLLSYTDPTRPYAAMAKAFVAQFEAELERFKNDGID